MRVRVEHVLFLLLGLLATVTALAWPPGTLDVQKAGVVTSYEPEATTKLSTYRSALSAADRTTWASTSFVSTAALAVPAVTCAGRQQAEVSVAFSAASATVAVTVAFYGNNSDGTERFLASDDLTFTEPAASADTVDGTLFEGGSAVFNTRGAARFRAFVAAPSAGTVTLSAWPY